MPDLPRAAWRKALVSPAFPRQLALQRGTLLALSRLMDRDGRLEESREWLCEATGVPRSTLIRHLAAAVAAGWLRRDRRGQKGGAAVYRASAPAARQQPTDGSLTRDFAVVQRLTCGVAETPFSDPPGGSHQEETETVVEGVAVDPDRGTRNDRLGGRAAGRPRRGVPDQPDRLPGPSRSPGGGPVQDVHSQVSAAAVRDPQRPAAAARSPPADVAASRGNHHSGRSLRLLNERTTA